MTHHEIVELRQYTLHPGRRADLIEVFDREFLTGQEAAGIEVLGQFSDLDRPDRFVWLRGFRHHELRPSALAAFYQGPVWSAHSAAANQTMVDWGDVLMLQPVASGDLVPGPRSRLEGHQQRNSLISIDVHHFIEPVDEELIRYYEGAVEPQLATAGSERLALLVTRPGPNDYPALPVREGEHVVVRIARFDDAEGYAAYAEQLAGSAEWAQLQRRFAGRKARPDQHLRLRPTARSRIC